MIDLHCHSIFSDGSKTPEELVALAETAGLTALALTDHDTTDGLERFMNAGKNADVETLRGIELSAEYGETPLHILGYGFDPSDATLLTRPMQHCKRPSNGFGKGGPHETSKYWKSSTRSGMT